LKLAEKHAREVIGGDVAESAEDGVQKGLERRPWQASWDAESVD
jgi:hypothetical protein